MSCCCLAAAGLLTQKVCEPRKRDFTLFTGTCPLCLVPVESAKYLLNSSGLPSTREERVPWRPGLHLRRAEDERRARREVRQHLLRHASQREPAGLRNRLYVCLHLSHDSCGMVFQTTKQCSICHSTSFHTVKCVMSCPLTSFHTAKRKAFCSVAQV